LKTTHPIVHLIFLLQIFLAQTLCNKLVNYVQRRRFYHRQWQSRVRQCPGSKWLHCWCLMSDWNWSRSGCGYRADVGTAFSAPLLFCSLPTTTTVCWFCWWNLAGNHFQNFYDITQSLFSFLVSVGYYSPVFPTLHDHYSNCKRQICPFPQSGNNDRQVKTKRPHCRVFYFEFCFQ